MNKLKKILITLLMGVFLVGVSHSPALAVTPNWILDTSTTYAIDFDCTAGCSGIHNHTMNVTSFDTTNGNFTATGFYTSLPQYSWTATGNMSNTSTMTIAIVYDLSSPLPGYTVNMTGTIDGDGDMSGTATSTGGESFTWIIEPNALPLVIPAECDQSGSYNVITGTNTSEVINGTSGDDLIFALGGSDVVNGRNGNDCIVGGTGSDSLKGNNGNDAILGGDGSDFIKGDAGNDDLYGESGSDSLKGGEGDDDLFGGDNSDSLKGDGGSDSADGGNSSDSCNAETETTCEA